MSVGESGHASQRAIVPRGMQKKVARGTPKGMHGVAGDRSGPKSSVDPREQSEAQFRCMVLRHKNNAT